MDPEPRLLILEDSDQDTEILRRELRKGGLSFDIRRADDREDFVGQLEEFQPDLIVSDYLLPAFDGLEALRLTREKHPDCPFILLSGYIGEEKATEALKSGATDVLLKDRLNRLVPAVQRAMREREEREERRRLEEMLRQSQKLESIGHLAAGIAHDFNNILAVVIGNLDLASEKFNSGNPGDEDTRHAIDAALKAALRGADLTDKLLAFSRRLPLKPKAIEVNGLVSEMKNLLMRTLGGNVEIRVDCTADIRSLIADPSQLQAALLNLAVNARDAMPNGGTLAIKAENADVEDGGNKRDDDVAPGHYVRLSISDTGTGIAPEVLAKVFEPFFTTKELGKGTGLGLSMVYGFARQSGGHVVIRNNADSGATVRLYLPTAGAADLGTRNVAAADKQDESTERAEGTVLVVDDKQDVRRTAAAQLQSFGYKVIEADGAGTALEILRGSDPVDLLFADILMPGGSGPDLADEAMSLRPRLKVLYTSGYAPTAVLGARPAGKRVRVLAKPYRREALRREIERALRGS